MPAAASPPRRGWYFSKANSRLEARYNNTAFLRGTATTLTLPVATTASSTLTVSGALVASAGSASGGAAVTGAYNTMSRATTGTIVTAVGTTLHVPALSLTDAGATGTIAELNTVRIAAQTVLATNTITYSDVATLKISDPIASTGATFTRKYGLWTTGAIRTTTNVFVGDQTAAFATTQPTGAAVFLGTATAPVGAVTQSGAIFSSTTVMRKIIADGTASNIET